MSARESLVQCFDDTRGRGRCRACEAPLTWYETTAGKRMPFDGEPVPRGSMHQDSTRRLIVLLSSDDVHWRTCPDADSFRRRQGGAQ